MAQRVTSPTSIHEDKDSILAIFNKYLDSSVADKILKQKESAKLGGKLENVLVYFSDLEGFTSISEELGANETINFINSYLTKMTDIIKKNSGIIDNYIGDAIVAYWPCNDLHETSKLACSAVLEQLEEIKKMKQEAEENAESDRKEKEKIEKMNQADSLIFNTEKQLKELGLKVDLKK